MVFDDFQKYELLKFIKKSMRKFEIAKYKPKNAFKSGFGRILGSIWEGFGTVLAVFWPLLRAFCRLFSCFGGVLNHSFFKHGSTWVQDELQEASGIDLGSTLEGSGKDFGGFGKVLEHFLKLFYVWTPALSREAPRSVSVMFLELGPGRVAVSMRGGPPPVW